MREQNGFKEFLNETPLFFKLFAGFLIVVVVGAFLYIIIRGLGIWTSNNKAPIMRRPCKIVDKRTEVWGGSGDSSASTNYFITFEFDDHTRIELHVKANMYGLLVVGDTGELNYQGTRFLDFVRMIRDIG